MLPSRFEYHRAGTLDEALSFLATYGDDGKVLAGGQSLIPMMKLRFAYPGHLIDVNRVSGLDGIEERDGALRIGALVRHNTLGFGAMRSTDDAALPRCRPLVLNLRTIGG
jgi:carbon-monoxide dehydrogenase medium subunit